MRFLLTCFIISILIGCSNNSQSQVNQAQNSSYQNHEKGDPYNKDLSHANFSKNTKNTTDIPNRIGTTNKQIIPSKKQKVILNVPLIKQNPELKYGCEVTSLAMILQYAGLKVDKMELAKKIPKDNDLVIKDKKGDIIKWGNPNHGFVGDMTGKTMGYAVYVKPTEKLMRNYLPDRTINLTNKPFDQLLNQARNGKPVLTWATGDFKTPDRWETWYHGSQKIRTPLDLHAVVLVGFDPNNVYVNDPLAGKKAFKINKKSFITAWNALGKQALSYR